VNITLLDLVILDLQPPELLQSPSQLSHQHKLRERVANAEQRIISRTAGLVQFVKPGRTLSAYTAGRPEEKQGIEIANFTSAEFVHRTALDFLDEDQEGREFLQGSGLTDIECMHKIFCAFIWKALHALDSSKANDEQVFRLANRIESLPVLPAWYTSLLQEFFDGLTNLMPDTKLRLDQSAKTALQKCVLALTYFEDATGSENVMLGYAAEFELVKFARWKLEALPLDHSQQLRAFFMVSCFDWASQYDSSLIYIAGQSWTY